MKSYSEYSEHSVSMVNIQNLTEVIRDENKKNKINYVIETGTYQGKGSTRMIAETFVHEVSPPEIITLEANWRNWKKAKKNLEMYNFVKPIWGLSVPKNEAIDFVKGDYAIHHQDEYPDIFIDGGSDPLSFYLKELNGEFGYTPYKLLNYYLKSFEKRDRKIHFSGEDQLRKYLSKYKKESPIIMLDSSGAIGLLEFNIVKEIMGDDTYYLLLDDIFHLKHFRSYEEIKQDPSFKILMVDKEGGWLFAKRN
jgi:hypothetical protein